MMLQVENNDDVLLAPFRQVLLADGLSNEEADSLQQLRKTFFNSVPR